MKIKLEILLLCAVSTFPVAAQAQVPAGRWEIVHTSGDNAAQTSLYPGGFSTYLYSDGTGDTLSTTANSICVMADNSIAPSWINLGGDTYQLTLAVNNDGLGPNVSFLYTGTYNPNTLVPGDSSLQIPTITGTYYATGDASTCSIATAVSPGNFVATFLPDLSSGSSSGTLDNTNTEGGTPFDTGVAATITFSAPPAPGEIAGSVSLAANPTLNGNACFATTSGVPNALTIDSSLSTQAGILLTIYAEGLDSVGNPTTLVLQGYSANLYTTNNNADSTANQMTSIEWAAAAAIGEDDPDTGGTQGIGTAGVQNDGTNSAIVVYYNVVGGVCNAAGGADAPFHFLAGNPLPNHDRKNHRHRRHHHRSEELHRRFTH